MAEEILSFAVQKLWDLLSQEYDNFHGIKDQVSDLQTDLNTLKSFLKDVEARKHKSTTVRNFVDVIKDIIFDAEDITETFILKDSLGRKGGLRKRFRRFSCIIPERRGMALEIGRLSKRIAKVISNMEKFGMQKIIADVRDLQPLQQRLREIRQEFATEYKNDLGGLEANVKTLVGCLVEEDDVQVVSITGMGGLGKTTLARQAFNHEMVKSKFDRLVWVCVTQNCDRMDVWQTILLSLRPKEEEKEIREMKNANRLQGELSRLFETSKPLIVFDDLWKEEDWDRIKPIFPAKKGWKVLITSRNECVTGRGDTTVFNFKPNCLTMEESLTLFNRIVLPRKDASELKKIHEEMKEMGKQMIEHCQGLPLAIRVLGGLLAANYSVHYWKRVSENIGTHLRGRTDLSDGNISAFDHVLSLSYEELPVCLKHCFLYLAHFPENYQISVEKLSYYWAAEGILRYNNDGDTVRDVGDSYIEELVMRNMVISERNVTTLRFETCHLHDMMREICLSKAKEENFLQMISSTPHSQSLSTSRRYVSQNPITLHVEREINNSKARSIVVVGKDLRNETWMLSSISFARLRLLRVLHLPAARIKSWKLPSSIGKLIHLRYLSLEASEVFHLPFSLGNLKLLIYLNIHVSRRGRVVFVPNVLMGMQELRYLALPRKMHEKTKLKLSNLVNLETLINFSTENCNLEDLHGMARLRTLVVILTCETSLETLSASICGLRHLEKLDVYYEGAKGMKEWRTLLEFTNLKQLKLRINIPLLSDELQLPSRLTTLSLRECCLEEDPMPILENLGQLKEVRLRCNSFRGRIMACSGGGFPQLRLLRFDGLYEWEEWIVEEGSMPLLNTLRIGCCNNLKELPDGLRFITSLKDLSITNMGREWRERLSERGKDYYKVQHIPSVRFSWNYYD